MSHILHVKSEKSKKEHIINKAIEFFSNNGFTGTRIDDITEALGIAKGTFYLYFKSKRDLLLDCIGQLTTIVVPKEVWEEIRKETDFVARHEKRLTAFLRAFPTFFGILNLLKSCIQSNDPALVKKASDTYKMLVNPLRKDLRWAVEHGIVGKVDEEVVSFILFGMGESVGYLLTIDARYTFEYVTRIVMSLFSKDGLLPQPKIQSKSEAELSYWDLTDSGRMKTRLRDIRFDGNDYVCGVVGNGEYRIPVTNFASMDLHQEDSQILAILSTKSHEKITLKIDGNPSLSGESQIGQYLIQLKDVACISLVHGEDASASTHSK
jgi:AcrR family transcriptional regulator